jgi:hypothetical protein
VAKRAGFETSHHPRLQLGEFMHVGGADEEAAGGAFGHDVGRHAAVGDDAVDALGVADVLAQLGDRRIGRHHRVERVEPAVGHCRSMRRPAMIDRRHIGHRDGRHGDEIHVRGVDHHGGVGTREGAVAGHHFLAAMGLFGGGAEVAHGAGQTSAELGQGQRRAVADGGDDVVAAGMADAGQGVVFRQDRHGRSFAVAELG